MAAAVKGVATAMKGVAVMADAAVKGVAVAVKGVGDSAGILRNNTCRSQDDR